MWHLDTTKETYTPNNVTQWTWAKVSAYALKYLKTQYNNVPSFVPLISKMKKQINMIQLYIN